MYASTLSRGGESPLLVVGETTWRRQYLRFGLLPDDRLRHVHIIGKTGAGKSTLLANLIAQDLARGNSLALLDPHGDLCEKALALVPRQRFGEVIYFNPGDALYPISFNIFRRGRNEIKETGLLASAILGVFRKQWREFWGPRLEHVLRNGLLAVAELQYASLLVLYRFFTDHGFREKTTPAIKDPAVRAFWQVEFPKYSPALQAEALSPALNKLGSFVSNPLTRNIIGQERSRIDLKALVDQGGILLANLSTGAVGEDASHLLGGLLLSSIFLSALGRRGGKPLAIYVDEFHHFTTDALANMLAEARKFGLGLMLAHQYLGQLSDTIRNAVLGNVGTTIVFRLGGEDAAVFEKEFAPQFTSADLQRLPQFEMAVKLLARGMQLDPVSARGLSEPIPSAGRHDRVAEIIRLSRERFAQPRSVVESAIGKLFTT